MTVSDMKGLPLHFMPCPPPDIVEQIPAKAWDECLEAWTLVSRISLSLPPELFSSLLAPEASLMPFLTTYVQKTARKSNGRNHFETLNAHELRRNVYLLVHRVSSFQDAPLDEFQSWKFLADFSIVYRGNKNLSELLSRIWHSSKISFEASLKPDKLKLATALDHGHYDILSDELFMKRLLRLTDTLPVVGSFLMTGSDLLDSLSASYARLPDAAKHTAMTIVFLSLLALVKEDSKNGSLLVECLYSLKTNAEPTLKGKGKISTAPQSILIQDLVSQTTLLEKIDRSIQGTTTATRAASLLSSLAAARIPNARPSRSVGRRQHRHRKVSNGNQVHVHQLSLITQLQDLFPDLGSAYLWSLLEAYDEDVERATAALLEDNLPPHLSTRDRSANIPSRVVIADMGHQNGIDLAPGLAPHSTPSTSASPFPSNSARGPTKPMSSSVPERRNVHDDDQLLAPGNRHRIRFGRQEDTTTLDPSSGGVGGSVNKAAILSALAAFDADDDERDDSYDIADVGGTVDQSIGGGRVEDESLRGRTQLPISAEGSHNEQESMSRERKLYQAYVQNSSVFARDAHTRRSAARKKLREDLGFSTTDEAIEGFAVVLEREPARLRALERKFGGTGVGGVGGLAQTTLERTAWLGSTKGNEDAESSDENDQDSGGRAGPAERGQSRGRGGIRGRGGRVGQRDDMRSRQRKEANKASRANHNRRDQRAKKMTRGGGMIG